MVNVNSDNQVKLEAGNDSVFLFDGEEYIRGLWRVKYSSNQAGDDIVTIYNVMDKTEKLASGPVTDFLDSTDTPYASKAAFQTAIRGFFF
jgi:hypothetical protein